MKISTRKIAAAGIGTAVFFILNYFITIPSGIPSTTINFAYAFMAFMGTVFGPIVGFLVGFIGHALTDIVHTLTDPAGYETVWWSWIIVSGFVGFVIGLCSRKVNVEDGVFGTKDILFFNLYQIGANIVGWGVLAPILDILIYKEPSDKAFLQGLTAGAANLITVAVFGTIFLTAYAKIKISAGKSGK